MHSSEAFRILGLNARTATQKDVKLAYARRLKETRPEDDRAGFMKLREAFETARRVARKTADRPDPKRPDQATRPKPEIQPKPTAPEAPEPAAPALETQSTPSPEVEELIWIDSERDLARLMAQTEEWIKEGCPEPSAFFEAMRDSSDTAAGRSAYIAALVEVIYRDSADGAEVDDMSAWRLPEKARPAWWSPEVADAMAVRLQILAFRPRTVAEREMFAHTRRLFDPNWEAEDDLSDAAGGTRKRKEKTPFRERPKRAQRRPRALSPVDQAMREIEQSINDPDTPATAELWHDILDREDLQPFDEVFALDQRLRLLVCRHTGLFDERKEPKLPDWLDVPMILMLDARFGWSHHFGNQRHERAHYDWLHKIIAPHKATVSQRQEFQAAKPRRKRLEKAVLWFCHPVNLLLSYAGYRVLQTVLRLM